MIRGLYDLLEGLLEARFNTDNLNKLQALSLNILHYQTRLLYNFELISTDRLSGWDHLR